MIYFKTQNSNLDKYWRVLKWKILVFLWSFGQFSGYILVIWYSLWPFGEFSPVLVCLEKEKSGNPVAEANVMVLKKCFRQKMLACLICNPAK
jgi:hypothetical protein